VPLSAFTIQYGSAHHNRNFPGIKPDRDWKSNTAFADSEAFLILFPVSVYERLS
jgi:hypothetical protein